MKRESIIKIVAIILACLFFYAALSKVSDFDKSIGEMRSQVFPTWIVNILVWLIPAIELLLVPLLIIPFTRKLAVWISLFLLIAFTIYIAIVMTGIFGRVPCSCGGILKDMSYSTHIIFNLFFIAISITGLAIEYNWKITKSWFYIKRRKELA